jgi:threonine dehydratase
MEPESHRVTWEDVVAASSRLWGTAHLTPVIECRAINERASRFGPCEFFFKCENLQRAGAFKFRGAFNAVSQLPESLIQRGVITHSSGNHAQALALAAKIRNAPAWIVMPRNAPEIKRNAVAGYGATVTTCEPTLAAREETAARITAETGATFIHPYNNLQVIAGQGTAALEMMEQVRELDVLIAPVGGGGLLSGTSIIARHHGIDVVGAEPLGADDAARSKASGKLIPQTAPDTVADGLLTSLGDLTWPFVRDYVNRIVTVPDTDTIEIMRFFWERAKLVIEPSSAVAVAAAISEEVAGNPRWKRIGVILSGGNVDLTRLPWQ